MAGSNKRWRERNPDKVAAHIAVNNALRSGRMVKQPCELCGNEKAHAHHEDYSDRLNVRWLCSPCHRRLHAAERGQTLHPPGRWDRKTDRKRGEKREKRKVTAPKKVALLPQAQALRSEGLSYERIGKASGVSIGTVYKWLNDCPYK